MYKRIKEYFSNLLLTLLAIYAMQIETLAELRTQTGLLQTLNQSRTETLDRVTTAAEYLARIEFDKRQRSGHPTI